jgi:hypothetical protein
MTKKIIIGLVFGAAAGVLDVIPMILQKLTWDANLSAFSMWIVSGFMISTSALKMNGLLKGIIISFILLFPYAILIGWNQSTTLIPIAIMTLILGSLLGFSIQKFLEK